MIPIKMFISRLKTVLSHRENGSFGTFVTAHRRREEQARVIDAFNEAVSKR